MHATPYGRRIYATGGGREAAYLSGVAVRRVIASTYVWCGGLAGVAGVMLAARLQSGQPTAGEFYELTAIAAVVLGGASLQGGEGTLYKSVIGVFIMIVLGNALNLLNVDSYWQRVAVGAVIIAAAAAGKGKVALLMGPSGAPTFRNLGDGYSEVMAKYPGIEIAFRADGPLTRERGVKQAEDVLVAHPDLAAIYTANDDVALGAMQAVNAANRKGKTLVTGMNGVPPALRAVKEENLAMTVELNPVEWGRLGVDVLAAFLKGDKVEPQVFIKHVIIDGANVDAKLPKT